MTKPLTRLIARCGLKYAGREVTPWCWFDADDQDVDILISAGLARLDKWVGEANIKPVSEIRDFFGKSPRFIKSNLVTKLPLETRIGLDMARDEFAVEKTKEKALDYYRAAGYAWTCGFIGWEELKKVGDCCRPYFDGERP